MALTATATMPTRNSIQRLLEMSNCHVIARLPQQQNITYRVVTADASGIAIFVDPLLQELCSKGCATGKTIVYCRSYADIINVYRAFILGLGNLLFVAQSSEQKGKLVEKYDACTESGLKTKIVEAFVRSDSVLRVVVATTAFGISINSPNVRRIVHWGPPESISMYVQQVGRCGRDKQQSTATLYTGHGTTMKNVDEQMVDYCKRVDKCRREMLMQPFQDPKKTSAIIPPEYHHVCQLQCQCGQCLTPERQHSDHRIAFSSQISDRHRPPLSVDKQHCLHSQLIDFHLRKMTVNGHHHMASRMSTMELLTGITDASIDTIVSQHHTIITWHDLV